MKFSTKQQVFIDAVMSGQSVDLSGEAGTGKSYVVKYVMEKLKEAGKNVVAIAPTGIAANNIGGQTVHSMFALRPFGVLTFETCSHLKSEKRALLKKLDTIIIDEKSMLRPDMLDAMNWTLIKNGCRSLDKYQVIFVGDLEQLPAVVDDNMRSVMLQDYVDVEFYHAKIYSKINPTVIELDEVLRQSDEEFIKHLNIVRRGQKSEYFRQFVTDTASGIILAPHNSTVAAYNLAGLESVQEKEYVFEALVNGNAKANEFNVESTIRVKHGCKIMYLVNSKNNNLINGTLGTFVVKQTGDETTFFIKVGEVEYALEKQLFVKKEYVLNKEENRLELKEIGSIKQMPIRLAYALTIHKSQGLTFDEITVDLSLPCFSKGQQYTAFSRVKTPQGLRIIVNRPGFDVNNRIDTNAA